MKAHMCKHKTVRDIVCSDCGRQYKSQIAFRAHKREKTCTLDRSKKECICTYCGKAFLLRKKMEAHEQKYCPALFQTPQERRKEERLVKREERKRKKEEEKMKKRKWTRRTSIEPPKEKKIKLQPSATFGEGKRGPPGGGGGKIGPSVRIIQTAPRTQTVEEYYNVVQMGGSLQLRPQHDSKNAIIAKQRHVVINHDNGDVIDYDQDSHEYWVPV